MHVLGKTMGILRKIGGFYKEIMMKNIGIFIFIGLLSVIFNEHGWSPNENIYAISQFVYNTLLPAMIAFEGGRAISGDRGGLLAVLAVSGILMTEPSLGIFGAILIGPAAGYLWRREKLFLKSHVESRIQMLILNLCIGISGCILAVLGAYVIAPVLEIFTRGIYYCIDYLAKHHMIFASSIVIEPAKVFFFNNMVNHAVLVPLGMGQLPSAGQSVLFLLEANPGPGLGMLAALYLNDKARRSEYASSMFAHFVGGIHEVYFPFALADLRLLLPLILGGMAGNVCFLLLKAGVAGAVSPGSIFILLLMAGRGSMAAVFIGVLVSAVVSWAVSMCLLRGKYKAADEKSDAASQQCTVPQKQTSICGGQITVCENENIRELAMDKNIENIVFVCDGGIGSSVMGAAIFRRLLMQNHISGITAEAFAADLVPDMADLIVCQSDFFRLLPQRLLEKEVYTVENLVRTDVYGELIVRLQRQNAQIH